MEDFFFYIMRYQYKKDFFFYYTRYGNNVSRSIWLTFLGFSRVKLNEDGVVINHGIAATCGGVTRDHYKKFLFEFAYSLN